MGASVAVGFGVDVGLEASVGSGVTVAVGLDESVGFVVDVGSGVTVAVSSKLCIKTDCQNNAHRNRLKPCQNRQSLSLLFC